MLHRRICKNDVFNVAFLAAFLFSRFLFGSALLVLQTIDPYDLRCITTQCVRLDSWID